MRVDIQQRYIHEVAFWLQQNALLRWTRYLIPRNDALRSKSKANQINSWRWKDFPRVSRPQNESTLSF